MNKALTRLFEISQKPEKSIIGLMSGTSLDGLDIVFCKATSTSISQVNFKTAEFPYSLLQLVKKTRSKEEVLLVEICRLNTEMAFFFAEAVRLALEEWKLDPEDIDIIASHGQTIYHNPDKELPSTFQVVDGDIIAQKTGIITISDFRQKHIAAGGEGAPLAQYLDEFLFTNDSRSRIALNLGGIANLTFIPSRFSTSKSISTDIGPANTLINEAVQREFNIEFDKDGAIAKRGIPHSGLVKYLLLDPFFRESFPKTTGQELFNMNWVRAIMESHAIELSPEDLIATLSEFTIKSITRALDEIVGEASYDLIVSGGGIHNFYIMDGLKENLPTAKFLSIEDFGITSEAKEAVLMAYLANSMFSEQGFLVNENPVHLGKICLPN